MDEAEFKRRTKALALGVLKMTETLPRTRGADVIARQIRRSATSVGANYRAACRSRSLPEMVAKLGIVEEEADETLYWLELLLEGGIASPETLRPLQRETHQILAMTVQSRKTFRARINRPTSHDQQPNNQNRRLESAAQLPPAQIENRQSKINPASAPEPR